MLTRRSLFGVLAGAVVAPIVVRSGLLMPVKAPLEFAAQTWQAFPMSPDAEITRQALRILHQKINFAFSINHQYLMAQGSEGLIRFRRPAEFRVRAEVAA